MIPFSPPRIDNKTIEAVTGALRSGWITTGSRTKLLEKNIAEYCKSPAALCLNSATAGLELALRWFGVGEGDEVILPAYTYAATANVIIHCNAVPVIVDINPDDFNISVINIAKAITKKTKVIIPVDFGGLPCDYDLIFELIYANKILFMPGNEMQEQLGRILILADAAHSLGAKYKGKRTGALADISVFSFHAVKNLTTAEGGALILNLPKPFDNTDLYKTLSISSLHGQTKDALEKNKTGGWKYDIIEAGYKCNMTDIAAAMGLVELKRYEKETLKKRKEIIMAYLRTFSITPWAELPVIKDKSRESSYHLFPLRIKGIDEPKRDLIIQNITKKGVSVNVHFIPLPMLRFYKNYGFKITDFPVAYHNYSREISLPVYYNLKQSEIRTVITQVIKSVEQVLG